METASRAPTVGTEPVIEDPKPAAHKAESPKAGSLSTRPGRDPSRPRPQARRRPRHRRARGRPLSEAELAARRANLAKARAADKDWIYRPTARRQAASRANIQKAIAWRRSPEGNAIARLNAFKHGLAVKGLPDLLTRLGEAPEDFAEHRELVEKVFRPESAVERQLVHRLAQATWRRIRLFRAQARYERTAWQRLLARAGQSRRLTVGEVSDRVYEVSKLFAEARLVEGEAWKLEDRIERILAALVRARAKEKGIGD